MAKPPRLSVRGVEKSFGATRALAGVDLDAARGEVHAVLGENGAGKSTLMAVLAGAILPDAGRMLLDGQPHAPRDPLDARRAGVAIVYQEPELCEHLSVAENIVLGAEPRRFGVIRRREIAQRAAHALDLFAIQTERARRDSMHPRWHWRRPRASWWALRAPSAKAIAGS